MEIKWISVFLVFFSVFKNGDSAITEWNVPPIPAAADGTGTLSVAEDQALNTGIVTYEASTDSATVTYSLVTAVTPFALSTSGELSITAALDHETLETYTLHVKAEDDTGAVGTATITVTITDVNEAPMFSATYSPCILDGSQTDATLTTVQAMDEDTGNTISYSITNGNTNTAFKIDATSGLIQVAAGITLDKTATSTYDLEVTATDNGSPVQSGTTTVSASVQDVCENGSVVVTISFLTLLFAFLVTKA